MRKVINNNDEKAQELFAKVQAEKAALNLIDNPRWKTDLSFPPVVGGGPTLNLHTLTDVNSIVTLLAQLISYRSAYSQASLALGVPYEFKWKGYSLEDWESDFKARVQKIQVGTRKAKLAHMEAALDAIISPELKNRLLLEQMEKELA